MLYQSAHSNRLVEVAPAALEMTSIVVNGRRLLKYKNSPVYAGWIDVI